MNSSFEKCDIPLEVSCTTEKAFVKIMVAAAESLSRSELSVRDKNEAVSKSMSLEKQLENWGWLGRLPCI